MRRGVHLRRFAGRGAALLMAMLTVALVATLAAGALWQQWRSVEVETAERARMQAHWILSGALDWARLILREDGRTGGVDSLSEPWAVALKEVRLSTFVASQQGVSDADAADLPNAFLAGRITDLQSRLNLANLAASAPQREAAALSLRHLFDALGLPPAQAQRIIDTLQPAAPAPPAGTAAPEAVSPLLPVQSLDQLAWIGIAPEVIQALQPHAVMLPLATPLNLNTASVEALQASVGGLDLAGARRLVELREQAAFRNLAEVRTRLALPQLVLEETRHAVATRFFEVYGSLRLGSLVVHERSVLQRDGLDVRVLSRERGVRRDTVTGTASRP